MEWEEPTAKENFMIFSLRTFTVGTRLTGIRTNKKNLQFSESNIENKAKMAYVFMKQYFLSDINKWKDVIYYL